MVRTSGEVDERMDDYGFVWSQEKYRRVIREHDVRFFEVVSVFDDQLCCEFPDPQEYADRWVLVGRSSTDRVLAVVYSEEELPLYRIITAFEAEGPLLDEYHKEKG